MPDTLLGGFLLSIINMTVVFAVLGFLALVIRVVAKAVHTAETPRNAGVAGTGTGFTIPRARDANGTCGDLTVKERVAVIAAVMAATAGAGRRHVFVRGFRDSGAWGKLGKAGAVHQGRARR